MLTSSKPAGDVGRHFSECLLVLRRAKSQQSFFVQDGFGKQLLAVKPPSSRCRAVGSGVWNNNEIAFLEPGRRHVPPQCVGGRAQISDEVYSSMLIACPGGNELKFRVAAI